jgi:DNA-binding beta-propeller fold protein YncE
MRYQVVLHYNVGYGKGEHVKAHLVRVSSTGIASIALLTLFTAWASQAQVVSLSPYKTVYNWDKLQGRKLGVPSGIQLDPDGQHLWILDRCGANDCANSDLDPILKVDFDGKIVQSFGKGKLAFPHAFLVDRDGNVWVSEGAPAGDPRGAEGFKKGLGHQVIKFDSNGKVLMTLGEAGVAGADDKHFNGPSGIAIAANGDIWITDGHGGPQKGPNADNMFGSRGGNNRLVRFSKEGKFIKAWGGGVGSESHDPLRFNDPHGIAIDSQGRIYIADRGNLRVQVLDKDGNFITQWTQFGKPSAIVIDDHDNIYVADGMSNPHWNPGWERGIRIADLKTGWIKAFIPDTDTNLTGAGTEFMGLGPKGSIYSGASSRQGLIVYEPFRPLY